MKNDVMRNGSFKTIEFYFVRMQNASVVGQKQLYRVRYANFQQIDQLKLQLIKWKNGSSNQWNYTHPCCVGDLFGPGIILNRPGNEKETIYEGLE